MNISYALQQKQTLLSKLLIEREVLTNWARESGENVNHMMLIQVERAEYEQLINLSIEALRGGMYEY